MAVVVGQAPSPWLSGFVFPLSLARAVLRRREARAQVSSPTFESDGAMEAFRGKRGTSGRGHTSFPDLIVSLLARYLLARFFSLLLVTMLCVLPPLCFLSSLKLYSKGMIATLHPSLLYTALLMVSTQVGLIGPALFFVALALVFATLRTRGTMDVLFAAGLRPIRLMAIVLAGSVCAALVVAPLTLVAEPMAYSSLARSVEEAALRHAMETRDEFVNLGRRFRFLRPSSPDVPALLVDPSSPSSVLLADSSTLSISAEDTSFVASASDVDLLHRRADDDYDWTHVDALVVEFPRRRMGNPAESSTFNLLDRLRKGRGWERGSVKAWTRWLRRWSNPLACIPLGLMALALSMRQSKRRRFSIPMRIALVLLVWYVIHRGIDALVLTAPALRLSAFTIALLVFLPHALFLGIAFAALSRSASRPSGMRGMV